MAGTPKSAVEKTPKVKTRDKILKTSLALFNAEGEAQISTVDIAAVLGISPGNLYYHFKGKEAIIEALFDGFEAEMRQVLSAQIVGKPLSIEDNWIFVYIIFEEINDFRFAVWLLTSLFRQLPSELYYAARVDGCTPLGAFLAVLLPLARPGLAVAALLVFIFSWNEFMFALTLTASDSTRTAPVAVALFPGLYEIPWGDLAAASLIVTVPVAGLAVLFQRHIVAGLTAGSVKG